MVILRFTCLHCINGPFIETSCVSNLYIWSSVVSIKKKFLVLINKECPLLNVKQLNLSIFSKKNKEKFAAALEVLCGCTALFLKV